jgi:hypothetical protein
MLKNFVFISGYQHILGREKLQLRRGYTAKTQYRKFETNIPEKELLGYSPNSYIHVSVSDLYILTISAGK